MSRALSKVDSGPWPVGEARIASAATGTAITSTAVRIPLPLGTSRVRLRPRNFGGGGVVAQYALCPWLNVLVSDDLLATATDASRAAQDNNTATVVTLSSLATLANLGVVLVGAKWPFRGLDADVGAANANASVLSVHYWNGSAWVDTTAVDGTTAGGATFAQDGLITWTPAAAWTAARIRDIGLGDQAAVAHYWEPQYWVRLTVSAALDASTTLRHLLALPRSTSYVALESGDVDEFRVHVGDGGVSALEAAMDAGTGNLLVNAFTGPDGRFQ